mmetsp:Transcript_30807/g.62668  ORF Transcript_30807/g.62668 Transcript_30807/m.62668 type:complete len:113 (+) Transcript_30807:116-454(+)
MAPSAIELLENLIADLEGKLNLAPGADLLVAEADKGIGKPQTQKTKQNSKKKQPNNENKNSGKKGKNDVDENIPEICKLEFKVIATIVNNPLFRQSNFNLQTFFLLSQCPLF